MIKRPSRLVPVTQCRLKRQQLLLSQEKLAELAGVPQPYISRIERGDFLPYPDVLIAVGKILDIEPEELSSIVPSSKDEVSV